MQKTFEFAKLEKNKSSAQRVIQFVFVDENCKLKLETKSSNYYAVSTIKECLSLVSWLDDNIDQTEEIVVSDYENRTFYWFCILLFRSCYLVHYLILGIPNTR